MDHRADILGLVRIAATKRILGDGMRPIHVVCSPKDEYLAIITCYLPDEDEWSDDLSVRL